MRIKVFIEKWDGYNWSFLKDIENCTCDSANKAIRLYEPQLDKYINDGVDVRLSYKILN